ncbi:MAG: hypothetical protein ACREVE_08755 [Gammaproteobacteria bacterium]
MIPLLALQFTLPLILVAWIGIAPPRNLLGYCIQVVGTATTLFVIGLIGLWTFLPWWAPYGFGCLLLIAMLVRLHRRQPFISVLPSGIGGWIVAALFLALGGLAAVQAALALAGARRRRAGW